MKPQDTTKHLSPYDVNYYGPFDRFWTAYGQPERRILFIYGAGFDPRAIPALASVSRVVKNVEMLHTFCTRFTNRCDENFVENNRRSDSCLETLRRLTDQLTARDLFHYEVEVNMFSEDSEMADDQLLKEFKACLGNQLTAYTDVIVDISCFPRILLFKLMADLWRARLNKNLFALLTEVPVDVRIRERGHGTPRYLGKEPAPDARILWVPILGGAIERFRKIHDFLKPFDVVPIIPFPAKNPRVGDNIVIDAWRGPFGTWKVPLANVLYASADNPFDVFRKVVDVVTFFERFVQHSRVAGSESELCMVLSALSGRSLSLGVLLAGLHKDLSLVHSQPITYELDEETYLILKSTCTGNAKVIPTMYWLAGDIYGRE